ncbi:MAG: hypothetical protein ACP5NW_01375 [Candidatus Woesearchaeota archaeon]
MTKIIGNPDKERQSRVDTEKWKEHAEYYKNLEKKKKKIENWPEANNLEGKLLKYNQAGEPVLKIHPKEKTAVYVSGLQDFDNMMQIYESAGWKEISFEYKKPTDIVYGNIPNDATLGFGDTKELANKKFILSVKYLLENKKYQILTFGEFCHTQKITQEMLNELNIWYNKNKPDRNSIDFDLPF